MNVNKKEKVIEKLNEKIVFDLKTLEILKHFKSEKNIRKVFIKF